jgi:hypothetical protein
MTRSQEAHSTNDQTENTQEGDPQEIDVTEIVARLEALEAGSNEIRAALAKISAQHHELAELFAEYVEAVNDVQ